MKKMLFAVFFIPIILFAQHSQGSVKFGYYAPNATDGGFIIGYEGGRFIDNNFMIGWGVDWFNKNYVDKKLVQQFNQYYGIPSSTINELRAKTNVHEIPLTFSMTANFPAAPRINFYGTGGVGLDVLLIFYKNFQNPADNEFHGAFDFTWRIGAGIMYELGSRSDVLFELAYHHSNPSWDYEVNDGGVKRVFERSFDMSGFMFRMGFRFYY